MKETQGLRSTSKKALENIRNYIVANTSRDYQDFDLERAPEGFNECALFIYKVFMDEVGRHHYNGCSYFERFKHWCGGLPHALDTCYLYNRSAVKDLGDILEQPEEERKKYDERQAKEQLTWLIYREISKVVSKNTY